MPRLAEEDRVDGGRGGRDREQRARPGAAHDAGGDERADKRQTDEQEVDGQAPGGQPAVRPAVGRHPHSRRLAAEHPEEAEGMVQRVAMEVLARLALQGGVAVELGMAFGDEVEDPLLGQPEVRHVGQPRVLQAQLVAQ